MRSLGLLLAIALLGASPPPAVRAADRVAELAGTWTCRNPRGGLSTVVYRVDPNGVTVDETGSASARLATGAFYPAPGGGWQVDRNTSFSRFSGFGPAWTGDAWAITDSQKHGTEIRYERIDDRTLKRTFSISDRAPYAGEICAKGASAPDPALCAVADVPATVLRPMEPDPPVAAMQNRISGMVKVLVSLDADGRVVDATIEKSDAAVLNAASLTAARQSTYQPALHDCKPVPSRYTFAVEYSAR